MEEQKTSVQKKCFLVFLYTILLLCTFIFFDCTGIMHFAFGYYIGNFILLILMFGLVGLCFIFVLMISIIELIITWKKNTKQQGMAKGLRIRGTVFFAIILYVSLTILLGSNSIKHFHEGFFDRVKNAIDVEEVRGWLFGLDEETFNKWSDFYLEKSDSITAFEGIFDFKPSISCVKLYKGENENDSRFVLLDWGGFMGHWGVVIGSEEMEIHPSDSEPYGLYPYKVEEGVWGYFDE